MDGENPGGNLRIDSQGDIFGVTETGGTNNLGTLYELPAGSNTVKTLFNFTSADAFPNGGVIADSQGNLYGLTGGSGGAPDGHGAIYEFNMQTQQLTTLFSFNGVNGDTPGSELYLAPDGDLIGTTVYGGEYGFGDIFQFDPETSAITVLHNFSDDGTDGIYPSGIVADSEGNLYGVGGHGGVYGAGTIFELAAPEPRPLALLVFAGIGLISRCRLRSCAAG